MRRATELELQRVGERHPMNLKPRVIHGTPITPNRLLAQMHGESFCVSFARPDQLEQVLRLQDKNGMLLLDNGAFSHWRTTGGAIDRNAFFAWANAIQARSEVAVAVIPDIIGGDEEQNWLEAAHAVRGELSHYTDRLMFCWHMNDSLEQLQKALRLFNFVAIGSCAEYDIQKHKDAYLRRLGQVNAMACYVEQEYGRRPWIHLMRGLAIVDQALFVQSADSSNVARNHQRTKQQPEHVRTFANRIRTRVARAAALAQTREALPTSNFS